MENKPVMFQVVQHLKPGGIETMVLDFHRFLTDYDVHIVSIDGEPEATVKAWDRLAGMRDHLHFLNKPAGLQFGTVRALARLLRTLNAQWVHTHHIGPLLYGGLAARLAGNLPLIHTEHDAWHLEQPKNRRMQRALIWLTRPILVADAQLVASNCKRFLPSAQYHLIPNGIDTERFTPGNAEASRKRFGLPLNTTLIGCAARLEPVKGVDQLIQALKGIRPDVHLAIAGQGSQRQALETLAASLGLTERVHFLGGVNDMPDFYRALDLFCLTSHKEGLPLSPLEAQASGVPCVLTDVGGSKEALCPTTGRLVQDGDIPGLSEAINQALLGKTETSPRDFVREHRDVAGMTQSYLSLLNAVTQGDAP